MLRTTFGLRVKKTAAQAVAKIRSWPRPITVTAVVFLLVLSALPIWRGVATLTALRDFAAASVLYDADQAEADAAATQARATLAEATTLLAVSEGKVLTEDPRTALSGAISAAENSVEGVSKKIELAETVAKKHLADESFLVPGSGIRASTAILSAFHTEDAALSVDLSGDVVADLTGPIADVRTAMAEWKAEQERILRERYTNNVQAVGWLDELDECTGSVDVTAYYLDIPTIAEHWSCGGKDFPLEAGTLITLTGKISGTYRVEGVAVMLSATRHTAHDIPTTFDLMYQTCQDGNSETMSFVGLTKL